MGFREHQVGLRLFWALNHVFSSDPVRFWGVFEVFWGLRWISLGFPWSSWWKRVNCGIWRRSGEFRVVLGGNS